MLIKKIFLLLLLTLFLCQFSLADNTINAKNNATVHNNKGLMYLQDNYYFGAIKEFQMAIDLNPNSQVTAVYYVNLGNTYEKIGYPALARPCYEKALKINVLCFDYYLKVAEIYKKLDVCQEKLNEYIENKKSPFSEIMIGLLYIQSGDVPTGITVLDEFCNKEPNLLVTVGVRNYLDKLTEKTLSK